MTNPTPTNPSPTEAMTPNSPTSSQSSTLKSPTTQPPATTTTTSTITTTRTRPPRRERNAARTEKRRLAYTEKQLLKLDLNTPNHPQPPKSTRTSWRDKKLIKRARLAARGAALERLSKDERTSAKYARMGEQEKARYRKGELGEAEEEGFLGDVEIVCGEKTREECVDTRPKL